MSRSSSAGASVSAGAGVERRGDAWGFLLAVFAVVAFLAALVLAAGVAFLAGVFFRRVGCAFVAFSASSALGRAAVFAASDATGSAARLAFRFAFLAVRTAFAARFAAFLACLSCDFRSRALFFSAPTFRWASLRTASSARTSAGR